MNYIKGSNLIKHLAKMFYLFSGTGVKKNVNNFEINRFLVYTTGKNSRTH